MKESQNRKTLAVQLGADIVTSLDLGGHRRFRSGENQKWGYCKDDGTVVQKPRFDSAEHLNPTTNTYSVMEDGKIRFYDSDWSNSWSLEQHTAFRVC